MDQSVSLKLWNDYLFQTFHISSKYVLTHQFLHNRVRAAIQLSEKTQAETLQKILNISVKYFTVCFKKFYTAHTNKIIKYWQFVHGPRPVEGL